MAVEVRSEASQMAEETVKAAEEPVKVVEAEEKKREETKSAEEQQKDSSVPVMERSSSFREESNFLSDLKESERKALIELRAKVEEAILENKLFKKEEKKAEEKEEVKEKGKPHSQEGDEGEKAKSESKEKVEVKEKEDNNLFKKLFKKEGKQEEQKPTEKEEVKETEKPETQEGGEGEKAKAEPEDDEEVKEEEEKPKDKEEMEEEEEKPISQEGGEGDNVKPEPKDREEVKPEIKEGSEGEKEEPDVTTEPKAVEAEPTEEKPTASEVKAVEEAEVTEAKEVEVIDKEVSLWGVPLLPSKGSDSTDVILLKFLRAREFKVKEAFEMLQNTLRWRKEFNVDSILDELLDADLGAASYTDGIDREGHPVCYNVSGVFQDDKLYQKIFGTEEGREKFLKWRVQLMEKGIQKLDFHPGGVASMLQITDLKDSPGPSKKELRIAMKQVVQLLQDNYPEFVARNIFINVPFWYYAFNALLSPFLTQRTKSKFVFARPAKVTETLLKYIPAEAIPIKYGGLKRENDIEFSVENGGVSELIVKAGSTECIEIPAPEVGTTLLWDLIVLGWEVNYKEEFVPTDEGSYTIIVQKGRKLGSQEEPIRNSFKNSEPGKVVLTFENNSFKKKKVLYRFKTKSN
ncbi:patellin-4 [Elaeis guineensis]|uniref:Patellin-4 n=1 Tax=Elaeis guineensis var. tenera TaxID=51953 RepID=A0A6I9RQU2_ELAGV|nr:patellin-4 [Elaeis guineensis]